MEWITARGAKHVIAKFFGKHFSRLLALRRMKQTMEAARTIQAFCRGIMVRNVFTPCLMLRLNAADHFHAIWSRVIDVVQCRYPTLLWSSISNGVVAPTHSTHLSETDELLQSALDEALKAEELIHSDNGEDEDDVSGGNMFVDAAATNPDQVCLSSDTSILMSSFVTKWLKQGDPKYIQFLCAVFSSSEQEIAVGY
jgi:hypothetical protein